MDFKSTVQYLYDLQKFGTKLGLDNIRALMELLGHPEDKTRFLHVTGTNGKGSVCALAASALVVAGRRTGLYTSPHLVSFTERIRVDGEQVSEDEVVALAERLRALVTGRMPGLKSTFFEFTTAMALDHFASRGTDCVVLEVGMGGRLDATNVVTPEVTVITNAELEHRQYLGDSVMDVAREKAGIVKPGVPLVTTEKKPEVVAYFGDVCRERGSEMYLMGRDFDAIPRGFSWEGGRFVQMLDYSGPGGTLEGLEIPLAGAHQTENAAAAACALSLLSGRGLPVGPESVRRGFASARWEGRLEVVSGSPLIVLDGAHNPAAASRLADAVRTYFKGRYKRLILVIGVLSDKDFPGILVELAPLADRVVFTRAEYETAVGPADLARASERFGLEAMCEDTVSGAIDLALSHASALDMVLVTGSLYLVGEAKARFSGREFFLKA